MNIGENISQIIERQGIAITELSDKMGIKRSTLYNWINGKTSPTMENIVEMSKILGINIAELIGLPQPEEIDRGKLFQDIIENNTDYKLIPKSVIEGEYRLITKKSHDTQDRLINALMDENQKLWALFGELKTVTSKNAK